MISILLGSFLIGFFGAGELSDGVVWGTVEMLTAIADFQRSGGHLESLVGRTED